MKLTKELYRISEVAKIFNVSGDTVRNWIRNGILMPQDYNTTGGGHYRIKRDAILRLLNEHDKNIKRINVVYARESSSHQKESLNRQIESLVSWANSNGYKVEKIITDIASGMNFTRKGLRELISLSEQGIVDTVFISYKDRLARFGYELIQWLLEKNGAKIVVVNNIESPPNKLQEIIDDFVAIIHYFSMRIYGSRLYKQKSDKIKEVLEIEDS